MPQVRERVLRANLGLGRFSNVTADGLCSPTPCWSYDYKGQLTAGNGGSYLYDALGRRQQKTDAGGTVHSFVFDGDTPYTEFAPGFTRQTGGFYTYANGTTYFNRTDNLGTPRLSTDYTGAVQRTEGVLMGPFGDNFTETSSTLDFTGLAGGFWDSENNGEHFGAREYQNTHGAWLSPDPAGLAAVNPGGPQTWNRYAYVGNNPTSYVDPSGLKVGMCGSRENERCGDDPVFANTGNFGGLWNPVDMWIHYVAGREGNGWYFISGGAQFLFNSWDWYGGGGGNNGFGIPIKRRFSKTFKCGSTASQVMSALENNFASFADNPASGQLSSFAIFPPGPVSPGQQIDINVGLQAFGNTFVSSDISVVVQSETPSQLVFDSTPNHVLYPATVSFSASDSGNGSITFTTSVDGSTNGISGTFDFGAGGRAGETSTWNNLLNQVAKFCGN